MLFDIFIGFLMFTFGAVGLVEIVGPLWHQYAQHLGLFGDTIRYRHWLHHEKEYPVTALRPAHFPIYQSAGQWDWYVVAGVVIAGIFYLLPLRDAIPLTLGAVLYAVFVVDYFHRAFHLPHHWLHQYHWFQELILYHDAHHYDLINFGIVFQIFGPFSSKIPEEPKNLFPKFSRISRGSIS